MSVFSIALRAYATFRESLHHSSAELANNPNESRLLYAAEAAIGIWLASRQTPEKPDLI